MTRLIFDAFAGEDLDDPLAVPLGALTDAFDKEIRFDLFGDGAGELSIDPDSPQAAWVVQGNYVRVKRPTDAEYIFGFTIDEREDTFVSPDEQGGEVLRRGGRGAIVVTERARLRHVWSAGGTSRITDDGRHRWPAGLGTPGRVLKEEIDDAQARAPAAIPMVSYTFNATHDSAGNAWDAVEGEYELPIGHSILEAVDAERDRGTEIICTHDFAISAYREGGYQRDLSASIVFRKGVNIAESANVDGTYGPGSRILVKGSSEDGTLKFVEVTDGATAGLEAGTSKVGRRELFLEHGTFATDNDLVVAGREHLRQSRAMYDGLFTIGVTHGSGGSDGAPLPAAHYEPIDDYRIGDLVTLDIPGAYNNTTHRITAIILRDSPEGEDEVPDAGAASDEEQGGYEVTLELDGIPLRKSKVPSRPAAAEIVGGNPDQDAEIEACGSVVIGDWQGHGLHVTDGDVGAWGVAGGVYHVGIVPSTDHGNCSGSTGPNIWSGTLEMHICLAVQLSDPCDDLVFARMQVKMLDLVGGGSLGGRGPFDLKGGMSGEFPVAGDHTAGMLLASGISAVIDDDGTTVLTTVTVPLNALNFGGWTRFVMSPKWKMSGAQCCNNDHARSCGGSGDYSWGISPPGNILTFYRLKAGTFGWITAHPLGTQDGSNRVFTLIGGYDMVDSVARNGVVQPAGSWVATDGSTLTTVGWAPEESDNVSVRYRIPVPT